MVVMVEMFVVIVLDLVLANHVKTMPTADQENIVVIVVKVVLANVL